MQTLWAQMLCGEQEQGIGPGGASQPPPPPSPPLQPVDPQAVVVAAATAEPESTAAETAEPESTAAGADGATYMGVLQCRFGGRAWIEPSDGAFGGRGFWGLGKQAYPLAQLFASCVTGKGATNTVPGCTVNVGKKPFGAACCTVATVRSM